MATFAEAKTHEIQDLMFPTSVDALAAQASSATLRAFISSAEPFEVTIRGADREQSIRIPPSAARLLAIILDELSRGHAVSVVPVHAELTTQEAADMLNVSRPTLIEILEGGELPYHRVKKHRRIRAEDLMRFKRKMHADAHAAMGKLVAYDQELDI